MRGGRGQKKKPRFFFFHHHRQQREQSMDCPFSLSLSPTTSSLPPSFFSHRKARAPRAPTAPGRETPGRAPRRCAPSRAISPATDGAGRPRRPLPRRPRAGARAPRRRAPPSRARWPRSWASPGGRRARRASTTRRRGAGTSRAPPRATRTRRKEEGRRRWLRGWERAPAMPLLPVLSMSRHRRELHIVRREPKESASSPSRRRAGEGATSSLKTNFQDAKSEREGERRRAKLLHCFSP